MPPRTRTAKSTKALKENVGIGVKTKLKPDNKVPKLPRKVLGDKTNSASDDNASIEIPNKTSKKHTSQVKITTFLQNNENVRRPRRDRRIPSRFVENEVLKNLSNNKENTIITAERKNDETVTKKNAVPKNINNDIKSTSKNNSTTMSPFKTPQKVGEISLVVNRPRRISRLPSRFEDHSISPSKFIPVQPCHASTPINQKKAKELGTSKPIYSDNQRNKDKEVSTAVQNKVTPTKPLNKSVGVSSDTNNNAKGRTLRTRKGANSDNKPSVTKSPSKNEIRHISKGAEKAKQSASPVKKVISSAKTLTLKAKKSPVKKVISPTKRLASKAKKSPVKPASPVKHSYLNENKNCSYKVQTIKSPVKPSSPIKKSTRALRKDLSFKVLEENKKNENNQDVYEFTFDPNEEPAPQKKKRKAVKRKPAKPKPKTVIFKNNYDQNVNKALAALKNAVAKNLTQVNNNNVTNTQKPNVEAIKNIKQQPLRNEKSNVTEVRAVPQVQRDVAANIIIGNKLKHRNNVKNVPQIEENILLNMNGIQPNVPPTNPVSTMPEPNQSTRVEDIAADFESSPQHDIDYSPVNSPSRPKTPVTQISSTSVMYHHDDPLNLKGNISFDSNPIASSSMNTSVRHPHASPWRVEFEKLPIRWHVNSYVKGNMTPAVECSFINFEDKKKHVYTNIGPENNEVLPEIVEKDQPNLVQTSIFSFIKEVVERSSAKKNRGRSATPVTASLFNEATPNLDNEKVKQTTRQLFTPKKSTGDNNSISETSNTDSLKNISNDKENSKDSSRGQKRKNDEKPNEVPSKTSRKDKDDKYFGFDDSENLENVSPPKDVGRKKSVRQARARAVLREMNEQTGPTRAAIPVAVKSARRAEADRLYEEMKSATDAPEIPAKEVIHAAASNVVEPIEELNEDSQTSVHLFEDIDIVHNWKLHHKSYEKAKKVTFIRRGSNDTQDSDMRPERNNSDEEEDLNDPTFEIGKEIIEEDRRRTKKKANRKQKMTKKEEEEAEAWAADFNSMCEDVEEFPLVFE